MKKEDREIALNPTQFRKVGSTKFIDLRTLDETDEEVYNTVYYKEVPVVTGNMDETLIVTYSPNIKHTKEEFVTAKSNMLKRSSTHLGVNEKEKSE